MQFTTVFTILAAAAAVSAYPGSSAEAAPKAAPAAAGGVKNNGNVCPKGQSHSCCSFSGSLIFPQARLNPAASSLTRVS